MLDLEIKKAIIEYNGKKRIADNEIKQINWFIKTYSLTVDEAVERYYNDLEADKNSTYAEYVKELTRTKKQIDTRCKHCPRKDNCGNKIFVDAEKYDLRGLKQMLRTVCPIIKEN